MLSKISYNNELKNAGFKFVKGSGCSCKSSYSKVAKTKQLLRIQYDARTRQYSKVGSKTYVVCMITTGVHTFTMKMPDTYADFLQLLEQRNIEL